MEINNSIYIVYGSRTGNASAVAKLAYDYGNHLGYECNFIDMQDFNMGDLSSIKNLFIAVSTHGEGEPPVQAESFFENLMKINSVDLSKMNISIVGLGDSSYRYFCQTGKDIDEKLQSLGAKTLIDFSSCDIDFEEEAKQWILNSYEKLAKIQPSTNKISKEAFVFELQLTNDTLSAYRAEVISKRLLTTKNSTKKVLHVSLSLKNSDIKYVPGDAIGVYGDNSRLFVDKVIRQLNLDPATTIEGKKSIKLLKDALIHDYELTLITPLVIKKYAEIINNKELNKLTENKSLLQDYADNHDILDLVSKYPFAINVEEFLSILRKLSPRLYSVASSLSEENNSVDITVKVIENTTNDRIRSGVISSYLWDRLEIGDKVPIYHEPIEKFRLPAKNKKIIMIAAGTGIAPFRSFLQDRENSKAIGDNWLFFGERNEKSDYLYQDDFEYWMENGLLTKITTAFSRDQKEKIYVMDKMKENGSLLKSWIEDGAYIYVCGSKNNLAKGVRKSLLGILEKYMDLTKNQARSYFEEMKDQKRYQEEIY